MTLQLSCLLYQKKCWMPARKWTEEYNTKRKSIKNYKCFYLSIFINKRSKRSTCSLSLTHVLYYTPLFTCSRYPALFWYKRQLKSHYIIVLEELYCQLNTKKCDCLFMTSSWFPVTGAIECCIRMILEL